VQSQGEINDLQRGITKQAGPEKKEKKENVVGYPNRKIHYVLSDDQIDARRARNETESLNQIVRN
jgi:hypothetical protein